MRVRRLGIAVCAVCAALAVGACGQESHPTVADANNDGTYVDAGPVTYQLEVSRVLNPYSTEDSQYLKGLPSGTRSPGPDQQWYGVFLWAKNQTHHNQTTADNFVMVDTQGNRYYPVQLSSSQNPYAWASETLAPLGIQPGPDTTASQGPTQGQLLLFKISNSAYANRPLTLWILGSANQKLATISLDL